MNNRAQQLYRSSSGRGSPSHRLGLAPALHAMPTISQAEQTLGVAMRLFRPLIIMISMSLLFLAVPIAPVARATAPAPFVYYTLQTSLAPVTSSTKTALSLRLELDG